MLDRLVLLGATGDLAGRYLLPALAALSAAGQLPEGFSAVMASVEDWDDDSFRQHATQRLEEYAGDVPAPVREALVAQLRYRRVDLDDARTVAGAVAGDGRPVAVYLALPPGLFAPAVEGLGAADLPPGSRIAVEKPFGDDLAGAAALNRQLDRVSRGAGERAVFRVDYFLGLAAVQSLLSLRSGPGLLEPVWNSTHVEQVDIVWQETLALEGRAGYYDRAGQLKDMVQNHLLQVLCLVAVEPPGPDGDLAARRLDVLRSVRPMTPEQAAARTRRARYTAGRIGDRTVPSYVDEPGVDPARGTETFAEMVLELDSPRWSGTRFVLRTGKGLGEDRMEVVVRFRSGAGELRVALTEAGDVTLRLGRGGPPLVLTGRLEQPALGPYGQVLLDVLTGSSTLSVRGEEAEEQWRVVEPVLRAWAQDRVPLLEYAAGSAGPPPLLD